MIPILALLAFLTPADLSTNLAPALDATNAALAHPMATVHLDWQLPVNQWMDGVIVHYGNQSGCYSQSLRAPIFIEADISNLDLTLPWYFAVSDYWESDTPLSTNCFGDICFTNYRLSSVLSGEVSLITSNLLPFLSVTGLGSGTATVTIMGWGNVGSHYTIYSGSNFNSLSTDIFETDGTNGVWTYSEPIVSGSHFFNTQETK